MNLISPSFVTLLLLFTVYIQAQDPKQIEQQSYETPTSSISVGSGNSGANTVSYSTGNEWVLPVQITLSAALIIVTAGAVTWQIWDYIARLNHPWNKTNKTSEEVLNERTNTIFKTRNKDSAEDSTNTIK